MWAVFSHVNFLFRNAHAGKTNTNTNTTFTVGRVKLAALLLFHFFSFLSSWWRSRQDLKMDEQLWNATVLTRFKAVLLDGVECNVQLSDELLIELTDTDDYFLPLAWLFFFFFFFWYRDKPGRHRSKFKLGTAKQKQQNEDSKTKFWPPATTVTQWFLANWAPEVTQPYSTCAQAHSRSLRIYFTAEFVPFFFTAVKFIRKVRT